nr:ACN38 regulatory protein [Trichoderma psychrophilum]
MSVYCIFDRQVFKFSSFQTSNHLPPCSSRHLVESLASEQPARPVSPADHARGNATRRFPHAAFAPRQHHHRRSQPCEYYWMPVAATTDTAIGHSATASARERAAAWYSYSYPYPYPYPSPSPPENEAEHSEAQIQTVDFPTILFLDPVLLQHGQVDAVRAVASIPQHVLQLLGSLDELRVTAARFFEHIHKWMPFISKKRFYDLYLQPSFQSRPDVALLLLALKLITTFPPAGSRSPRTALYHATKHFSLEVQDSFSILVLQAGLLVALYELGHGIYPAAYLSIGTCARYAHALGISVSRTVPTTRVLTLVEVEERRRVWWAIVILDRFVSIGCPGRPFATADPRLDDLLPADDTAFDQGTVRLDDISALSSPMTGHMSKFALLCQAARLLGQVLGYLSSGSAGQDDVRMQLDRTLQSMLAAALNVDCPDYDQITFVYSALLALYTPWLSSDGAKDFNSDCSRQARVVVQQITDRISANLIESQCFVGRDPEDLSPWGLYFAYRICGVHMRPTRRAPHGAEVLRSLREAIQTVRVRWNVAGVYLQLLEAQAAIHLGA